MQTTAERLQTAMDIRGMKQVDIIEKTGINKGALSSYISGKYTPKQNNLYLLAKTLNVSVAWLMGHDVAMETDAPTPRRKGVKIPVIGQVAAGIPIDAIEDIIDYEEIPEDMAESGDYFGLRIKGDSMSPRICSGDTVIVKSQADADSGDVVIVTVNGDNATCKRLNKENDGILLSSINPAYKPRFFSNEQIKNTPVEIRGKVVEVRIRNI